MAEEVKVLPTSVKYSGIFNMKDLYSLLYDLLTGLGYGVTEEGYKSTTKPDGSEDLEISWDCTKNMDNYTRFRIKIFIKADGISKVKVKEGDIEVTKNKGSAEVKFTAYTITDFENKWELNPLLKFFKGLFDKYIYSSTYKNWKSKIVEETYTIVNEVKSFFGLQKF